MRTLLLNRISIVWVLLILATALSWHFGHGLGFGDAYQYATSAILVITFVKVRFVFLDFMEVRRAPLPLRVAFEAWAVVACGVLIFLYWSGL